MPAVAVSRTSARHRGPGDGTRERRVLLVWVGTALVAVVAVRLPGLAAPPSSDEAGFLLVAGQWASGDGSLYGAYWVDRPPLLLAIFALADVAGGLVALRVLGCLAAAATVVAAAGLGRTLAGSPGARWTAVAAAAFVSMPLFDVRQTSNELLAVPFAVAGIWAVVRAGGSSSASLQEAACTGAAAAARRRLLLVAGGLGAAAVLVKQSFLDVFVAATALAVVGLASGRPLQRTSGDLFRVLAGGVCGGAVAVAAAAGLGTSPLPLFDAVVVFRFEASAVIAGEATDAPLQRALTYPPALLASGALTVVAVLLASVRHRTRDPLLVAAVTVLAWEVVVVVAGGSYWMHNLLGLVPGLVLATAVLAREGGRSWGVLRAGLVQAVVVTVAGAVLLALFPPPPTESQAAGRWLADHARAGDTAVTLYGKPEVLLLGGTPSPYEHLWSLPLRVRDGRLAGLTTVLRGPEAPHWVLVRGDLRTWAVRSDDAARALADRYRAVARVCGYQVLLRAGVDRPLGREPAPACAADEDDRYPW